MRLNACIVWENFGHYHYARIRCLRKLTFYKWFPFQLYKKSRTYKWLFQPKNMEYSTLCVSTFDKFLFPFLFLNYLIKNQINILFIPSYWPLSSFIMIIVGYFAGCELIMMNDTFKKTASRNWLKTFIKKKLISFFSGAIVSGSSSRAYFASLGLKKSFIKIGYDCVDNNFFQKHSRLALRKEIFFRKTNPRLDNYILAVGRFEFKKNFSTLIKAYSEIRFSSYFEIIGSPQLVIIGDGTLRSSLKNLALDLSLAI